MVNHYNVHEIGANGAVRFAYEFRAVSEAVAVASWADRVLGPDSGVAIEQQSAREFSARCREMRFRLVVSLSECGRCCNCDVATARERSKRFARLGAV